MNNGHILEYFDAFGFSPPLEIMMRSKGKILYSNKEIQDYNASTCGWFCIAAIVHNNGFQTFLNIFSKNTVLNDDLLSKFLKNKKITA